MKLKRISIIMVLILFSSIALADASKDKFCSNQELKESFYAIFYQSRTLKHKFTRLYQTVNNELKEYYDEACAKNISFHEIVEQSFKKCEKTCDRDASLYTDGKLFGKKEMGNEIFNECASICNTLNNRLEGYKVGLKDGNEANSGDCTNPSKDSLLTIGRVMKQIEHKNVQPAASDTHKSKTK